MVCWWANNSRTKAWALHYGKSKANHIFEYCVQALHVIPIERDLELNELMMEGQQRGTSRAIVLGL